MNANASGATAFLIGLLALPVAAQDAASKCADQYSDCHDTCSLRHGVVTKDTERIKLGTCLAKCKKDRTECRDRYLATQQGAVDPGALKKVKSRDDDLREDNKRVPVVDTPQAAPKASPEPDAGQPQPQPQKRALDEW
jgi:hypothetical protein